MGMCLLGPVLSCPQTVMPDPSETFAEGWRAHQRGDLQAAERAYRQALDAAPDHAEAWYFLGGVYQVQGDHAEAVACLRQAVRVRPDLADLHNDLGMALKTIGRLDEAAACYQQAIQIQPDFPEAYNNLGNVLKVQGRSDEAVVVFREALRLRPDFAEAHSNLGLVHQLQERWGEAAACHREALRLKPDLAEVHTNLGLVLAARREWSEAAACHREALRLKPDLAEAYANLGLVLAEQGEWDEAVACHRRVLQIRPDYPAGLVNLGCALVEQGKPRDAIACHERAIRLQPDSWEAHVNRAYARLLIGDFAQGWPELEWRLRSPAASPILRQARWEGASLEGGTLLILAEQGLGDILQFVRYAALARQRAGTVVLACPKPLIPILSACPGLDRVVDQGEPLPTSDAQVPLMSLPARFQTTLETVPADVPYLAAEPRRVAHWRGRLDRFPEFKVKSYRPSKANSAYRRDHWRSIPLTEFEPLFRVPGVRLFGLQRGPGREQMLPAAGHCPLIDLVGDEDEPGAAFLETAAILNALDLVITCDTSIAHLAGALGVPAWVALPFAADFRWLLDRSDTPWYPTLRLFRQARFGDWAGVVQRMAEALSRQAG